MYSIYFTKGTHENASGRTLVHDKFEVCQSPSLDSVMSNVLSPHGALNIHQHSGLRTLQLDHHYGLEVASLVPIGVEVAWEASEWRVGHLVYRTFKVIINWMFTILRVRCSPCQNRFPRHNGARPC